MNAGAGPSCATGPAVGPLIFADLAHLAGTDVGVSPWCAVAQADIDAFAEVTHDRQWIHIDQDRADRTDGGTIAHGLYILSLIPALTLPLLDIRGVSHILNYGMDRVRFLRPVRPGDRLRARQRVLEVTPRGAGLLVRSLVVIELEGRDERPACSVETLMLNMPETAG